MILSHAFWQRRFGGDEAVLGRELTMEAPNSAVACRQCKWSASCRSDFRFLDMTPQPDVILAVAHRAARAAIGNFSFSMLARLKPGVTPAEAHADVERMLPIWLDAWPTRR